MRLRPGRLLHDGGHPRYNAYVRARLDAMLLDGDAEEDARIAHDVHALAIELRARARATRSDLPWR